jgi:hypothetical protein
VRRQFFTGADCVLTGVIARLVPAISIRRALHFIIGMAGTSPAMTIP